MKELNEIRWKEFELKDLFPIIRRGKRLKTDDHLQGSTPYVSSSATNNGVDDFVGNTEGVRIFDNCLSIANSGSVGASFYHPYSFVASDHVTELKDIKLNKYSYLFLATLTKRLSEKYSFNREINESRIMRERILVPVTIEGEIDYTYMEAYMRSIEHRMLKNYIDKRLSTL